MAAPNSVLSNVANVLFKKFSRKTVNKLERFYKLISLENYDNGNYKF